MVLKNIWTNKNSLKINDIIHLKIQDTPLARCGKQIIGSRIPLIKMCRIYGGQIKQRKNSCDMILKCFFQDLCCTSVWHCFRMKVHILLLYYTMFIISRFAYVYSPTLNKTFILQVVNFDILMISFGDSLHFLVKPFLFCIKSNIP